MTGIFAHLFERWECRYGVDVADPDDVRAVLAERLPGYRAESVRPAGAGLDNIAYQVNGELIVRFRRTDPGRVEREARLLAIVAEVSPLPVPRPLIVEPVRGVLAYRMLPGVPLIDMPAPPQRDAERIAEALGAMLAAVHAVAPERTAGLVTVDNDPLEDWLAGAARRWPALAPHVPRRHHRSVERWLAEPPPATATAPVLSHLDLGSEHVLVDPSTWQVRGVIDWGDAAIGDPAYDLGLILRDLGPRGLDAALRARGGAAAGERDRAAFHARCGVLEELAYGLETNRRVYATKSLAALGWLF
jgi:aminoglycoside phosphotransferase (APT) family kinase protein